MHCAIQILIIICGAAVGPTVGEPRRGIVRREVSSTGDAGAVHLRPAGQGQDATPHSTLSDVTEHGVPGEGGVGGVLLRPAGEGQAAAEHGAEQNAEHSAGRDVVQHDEEAIDLSDFGKYDAKRISMLIEQGDPWGGAAHQHSECVRQNNAVRRSRDEAKRQKDEALKQKKIAEDQKKVAEQQTAKAEKEKKEADRQRRIADEQKVIARREKAEAVKQKNVAEEQTAKAEKEKKEADRQRRIADEQKVIAQNEKAEAVKQNNIAEEQTVKAEKEKKEADRQRRIADEQKVIAQNEKAEAVKHNNVAEEQTAKAEKEKKEADRQRNIATEQTVIARKAKLNAVKQKDIVEKQKTIAQKEKAEAVKLKKVAEEQTAKAEKEKAEAECQKKIAEDQKALAQNEKAEADRQRIFAYEQKAIANQEKENAFRKRKLADGQKMIAQKEKAEADRQKRIAEDQKAIANAEKAAAKQDAERAQRAEDKAKKAEAKAKESERQMETEVSCSNAFRGQTLQEVVVANGHMRVPSGVVLRGDPVSRELRAHRCPNPMACPSAWVEVAETIANDAALSCKQGLRDDLACTAGYANPGQGCARCAEGFGRSIGDPFLCVKCGSGSIALQFAWWLGRPAVMFAVSVHSAAKVAAGVAASASRERELLKIIISYCGTAALVGAILYGLPLVQGLSDFAKISLGLAVASAEAGSPALSSSVDCLLAGTGFQGTPSPEQAALVALALPVLVLVGALAVILIRKVTTGAPACSALLLCFVVAGNQFLPSIAGATGQTAPAFHTQKGNDAVSMMSYAPWEPGSARFHKMLTMTPFLLVALAAGPVLWQLVLRWGTKGSAGQARAFLCGNYRPECARWWEAFRLSKNMLLAFVCRASPMTYSPSALLAQVGVILILFLAAHACFQPCPDAALNVAEAAALGVMLLVVMAASFLLARSWSIAPDTGKAVLLVSSAAMTLTLPTLFVMYLLAKYRKGL